MIRNLLFLWLILALPTLGREAPAVFERMDFAKAGDRAKEQGCWLVVDATASWCPPCHKMDETTWVAPELIDYFDKHVLAIQIDVDEQSELAKKLEIKAMPTVIVFGPEGELDRVVGYKTAPEIIAWLSGVGQGKTRLDRLRAEAAETGDIESRYELARSLMQSGKALEAEELFLALWRDMDRAEWSAVRYSYLLDDLTRLVEQSPGARAKLETLRAEAFQRNSQADWFHLSKTLGYTEELAAWEPTSPLPKNIESAYFDFLVKTGHMAKAGRLLKNPAENAKHSLRVRQSLLEYSKDEADERVAKFAQESTRRDLLNLYAACQAAGRGEAALEVRRIALEDDAEIKSDFDEIDANGPQGLE